MKTNRDLYNLIVVERCVEFGKPNFICNEDILTLTDKDIRKKYIAFDDDVQAEIMKFPTLLCDCNGDICYICKIFNLDVGIKTTTFEFRTDWSMGVSDSYPKYEILDLSSNLRIGKVTVRNELQRPHWALKKADLITTLQKYERGEIDATTMGGITRI